MPEENWSARIFRSLANTVTVTFFLFLFSDHATTFVVSSWMFVAGVWGASNEYRYIRQWRRERDAPSE